MQAPSLQQNPEVKIGMDEASPELNLVPTNLSAPVYKQRRITQVSGGTTLAVTAGNDTLSQFVIPGSRVWNFSKSYITLDISVTSTATTGYLNNLFTDCLPLTSIQLQTSSGALLANLSNVQQYTKVSQAATTPISDYLTRGPVYGNAAFGTAFPLSQCSGLQPAPYISRTNNQVLPSNPSEVQIIDTTTQTDITSVPSAFPATDASGSDCIGRGAPQTIVSGAVSAGDAAVVTVVRYRIPLKAFVGTIFAMDKDLFFPDNLQIVIYWRALNYWGFQGVEVGLTSQSTVLTTAVVSNYYLYMLEDINAENHGRLRNAVMSSGMQILVPYTNCSQITTGAAGNYTISTPLTPGTGLCLKRVVTIPTCSNVPILRRTANTFNVEAAKWSDVQSSLNSQPLQDYKLVLSNSDVWNYMREQIKNSPAGLSQRTYEANCWFLDNFSDADDSTHWIDNDTKKSGLQVPQASNYEVTFTTTAAFGLVLCQYQTWIRSLVISPMGISWGQA